MTTEAPAMRRSASLPVHLWRLSCRLYAVRLVALARALKFTNLLLFRAILPYEAELGMGVRLGHYGLATVIHPNVTIGDGVLIWHGATLAVRGLVGSESRITIGRNAEIGAHAILITPENGSLHIGESARVGAGAIVTKDVPAGAVVVGRNELIVE